MKIKDFAIFAAIALTLLPATINAQNDTYFQGSFDDYGNRDVEFVYGMWNEPFGIAPIPFNSILQGNTQTPLGSGLLIMLTAGAGYAVARNRRRIRKASALLIALAVMLGFTQCGKQNLDSMLNYGENVNIILNAGNGHGGKHIIEPGSVYVPIIYEAGDVLYVSNGGHYAGKLICSEDDGPFVGNVNVTDPNDDLYFYFVGGLKTDDLDPDTQSFTIDISNQKDKLPVISMGRAEYIPGKTNYSCQLYNKCALVEFELTEAVHDDQPVKISNMFSEAMIDFTNHGINATGKLDAITLYRKNTNSYTTTRWAILLANQPARESVAVVHYGYLNSYWDYYDIQNIPTLNNGDFYYGDEAVVIDNAGAVTDKKLFIVSANGNVVQFSEGNLQYRASTHTWRFAQHPWDVVGDANKGSVYETIGGVNNTKCNNALIDDNYEGWIDLFGWGTWGEGRNPSLHTQDNADYTYSSDFNGVIDQDNHDDWRLLTAEEWRQLYLAHYSNSLLMGKGKIDGNLLGLIILPQKTVINGFIPFNSQVSTVNNITSEEWENNYKPNGAVFLPYPSGRYGSTVWNYVNKRSYYWSSTPVNDDYAYYANVNISISVSNNYNKYYGLSIRLVR